MRPTMPDPPSPVRTQTVRKLEPLGRRGDAANRAKLEATEATRRPTEDMGDLLSRGMAGMAGTPSRKAGAEAMVDRPATIPPVMRFESACPAAMEGEEEGTSRTAGTEGQV